MNSYFPSSPSGASSANQRGEMTPPQRALVRRSLFSQGCVSGVLLVFVAPLLIAMLVGLFSSGPRGVDWIPFFIFVPLAVGFGLAGLWMAVRFVVLALDWMAGRVEQTEGQIVWAKGSYKADAQGRQFNLISGLSLAPATYRLYYLPRAGVVVGGDKVGGGYSAREELLRALAQTNHFSVDKLAEYRAGRMGDERFGQITRLWVGAAVGGFAIVVVAGVILWAAASSGDAPVFVFLFVGGFALLIGGIVLVNVINTTRDLSAGEVVSAEGVIRRTVHRSNKSTTYYYKLDKLSFSVSGGAYNALVEGLRYRVFYLPRSKKLLGIEPLDEA